MELKDRLTQRSDVEVLPTNFRGRYDVCRMFLAASNLIQFANSLEKNS